MNGRRKRGTPGGGARAATMLVVTMMTLTLGALPATAQHPQEHLAAQHMQEMHERMQRLNDVMGRMQRIHEHAQDMEHSVLQQLERLRAQQEISDQDRLRIRDQERVRDMAHAMSTAAREMHQAMERARDLAGDGDAPWNREMHQEMEHLQQNWEGLCDQMEEGLQLMERLRTRLERPGS